MLRGEMTMRWLTMLCVMTGLAWTGGAGAQIYSCRDAKGQVITSDRPMPECTDRAVRELNRQGMVVREIPPPLTAEEKAKKAAEEAQEKKRAEELAEERRRDRLLLSRYETIEALEAARQRSLRAVAEGTKGARDRLALLEKEHGTSQAEIATFQKDGKRVPLPLTRKLESIEANIATEKKRLVDLEAETHRINDRFDGERTRYLQLTAARAAGK